MLFPDPARSDANPILLIDSNAQLAGHAASIGQVDQEDMYYRGVVLDKATPARNVWLFTRFLNRNC